MCKSAGHERKYPPGNEESWCYWSRAVSVRMNPAHHVGKVLQVWRLCHLLFCPLQWALDPARCLVSSTANQKSVTVGSAQHLSRCASTSHKQAWASCQIVLELGKPPFLPVGWLVQRHNEQCLISGMLLDCYVIAAHSSPGISRGQQMRNWPVDTTQQLFSCITIPGRESGFHQSPWVAALWELSSKFLIGRSV